MLDFSPIAWSASEVALSNSKSSPLLCIAPELQLVSRAWRISLFAGYLSVSEQCLVSTAYSAELLVVPFLVNFKLLFESHAVF